jgi:hypothetical protein
MKKMIIGLFSAVLMAAGLVGVSGGSASAACTVYAGCVDTKTKASGPDSVEKGLKALVCGKVKVKGSNADATGRLKFNVTRNRGGYSFQRGVDYSGGKVCIKTSKLTKTGGFSVTVKYKPTAGSAFNPSNDDTGFDVVS